jgi:hypothetical protein
MGYDVHIANFNLSIRGDEESRPVEANKMGADAYINGRKIAVSDILK